MTDAPVIGGEGAGTVDEEPERHEDAGDDGQG